jgi:antitoxin ParD1/3/4
MSLSLSPELERLIMEKVESGEYESPSHVLEVGLCLLAEENEYRQKLAELQAKLQRRLQDLDAGRAASMDDLSARPPAQRES